MIRTRIILVALLALAACRQGSPRTNEAAERTTVPSANVAARTDAVVTGRLLPAPAEARTSRYTSLRKDNCRLVEESDEGPYWRMHCGGAGGYALDYTESDLRQNLTVIAPDRTKTSLDLPSRVAKGAFDRLGQKVEWRGPAGEAPEVLVVRVHVANDQGEDDGGRLAVVRLAPKPCLIGIVGAKPGQSDKARKIADTGGACL